MKRLVILLLLISPAVMAQLPQDIKCRLGGSDDRPIVCQGIQYPPLQRTHQTPGTTQTLKVNSALKSQPKPNVTQDSSPLCEPAAPQGKVLKCDDTENSLVVSPSQPETPSSGPSESEDPRKLDSLPAKPEPRLEEESSSTQVLLLPGEPSKRGSGNNLFFYPTWRKELLGDEPIPPGMVWAPHKGGWEAREINSCFWCGRPMTFKEAAFDKKALLMWGSAVALAVADTERTLRGPCFQDRRCGEANPLLGESRKQQYGVRIPVLIGAWMGTAWLRKGDRSQRIGGMKPWWILPLAYQIPAAIGLILNSSRH